MSGGFFDYQQYHIETMAENVQSVIEQNGKKREGKLEPWEDEYYYNYPEEVIEKFKEGVEILKKAKIYAQRIDWLLSSDDGEESFLRRLKEELNDK